MTEGKDRQKGRESVRAGEAWSDTENTQLVDGVRRGWSIEELATAHGRSRSAVVAQLARMAPKDDETVPTSRSARAEWSRGRLVADPEYDWRGALRGWVRVYWSAEDDSVLRAGWDELVDLATLSDRFGVPESGVHARLMALGLSGGVVATVERLGCSAGGVMEARYRRATGQEPVLRTILAVMAEPDEAGVGGPFRHVSVHSSREAAAAELRGLAARQVRLNVADRVGEEKLRWMIGVRGVGQGDGKFGPDEWGELVMA